MGVGAIASSYAPAGGGGFVASDYGTVYAEWDFSDTGTITSSSGAVSAVTDLSGNGRTLSQGTGGNRPTTGTRTIGGLNAIDFDGTEWLNTANQSISQPFHIVVVAAADSASGTEQGLIRRATSARGVHLTAGGAYGHHYGTGRTGGAVDTSAHLIVSHANGASSDLRVDGSSVTTANPNTEGWSNQAFGVGAQVNGGAPFDGLIGHVIIYSAITNLAGLESAVMSKWGI